MERCDDPPDCLRCGVCCFSTLDRFVRVTGDDHARLGDEAAKLVTFVGNRAYMRLEDGHCAALRIDTDTRRFVCRVYRARPELCRELERGSAQCRGERATKSERARAVLQRSPGPGWRGRGHREP